MDNPLSQIEHVVVLMLENRSFDNVLGWLYERSAGFEGLDPLPAPNVWKHPLSFKTHSVAPRHGTDMTQPNPDPNEVYQHVYMQMFAPNAPHQGDIPDPIPNVSPATANMLGFLADYGNAPRVSEDDAANIMNCFRPEDVPVISQLARWYAVCDQWYASVPSQTFPNRSFVHAGTSSGYVNNLTGPLITDVWHNDTPTIFNVMEANRVPWAVYFGGSPLLCNALTGQRQMKPFGPGQPGQRIFPMAQFHTDLANYDSDPVTYPFPSYVFIEPNFLSGQKYGPENDEHPQPIALDPYGASNVLYGEQLIASVFQALSTSKLWSSTLFVVVFDEHGGTYDHTFSPNAAIPPDDRTIAKGKGGYSGFAFDRYGVRVPAVVMSPWIGKGTICSTEFDHTSILRTLYEAFLPHVTPNHLCARDAQARSLSGLLTETSPRTDLPPLAPRTPPPFDPKQIAAAPLTDFQKHALALGLLSMKSDHPDAVAAAGFDFQTHEDAWRVLDAFE